MLRRSPKKHKPCPKKYDTALFGYAAIGVWGWHRGDAPGVSHFDHAPLSGRTGNETIMLGDGRYARGGLDCRREGTGGTPLQVNVSSSYETLMELFASVSLWKQGLNIGESEGEIAATFACGA